MKRIWTVAIALLMIGSTYGARAAVPDAAARADQLLRAYPADDPGLAVTVSVGGHTVYAAARGLADLEHGGTVTPQTQFHAASISKEFTALAVLMLVEAGKVDLNADIRRYLPYVPDFGTPITVTELLQHSSGLRDQWGMFTVGGIDGQSLRRQAQVVEMVRRQRALNFAPGTEYAYSNTGFTLLAEIVRTVSGQSFRQFTTARIFQPLGMTHSFFYDDARELVPGRAASYAPDKDGRPELARMNFETFGATGLLTSAEDLAIWGRELLAPKIMPTALIARLKQPGHLRDATLLNYGFGLQLGENAGHRSIGHGGSDAGYRAMFLTFPDKDAVVAVLASGQRNAREIADSLANIFLDGGSGALPATSIDPGPATRAALAGDYVNDWRNGMRLADRDGKLVRTGFDAPDATATFSADGSFNFGTGSPVFRPVLKGGRVMAISETNAAGGHALIHRRASIVAPAVAELEALGGDYRSAELDVTYTLSVVGGQLRATSLQHPEPIDFVASDIGRFDSAFGRLTVQRGPDGRPSGFLLDTSGSRVLKLAFAKVLPSR